MRLKSTTKKNYTRRCNSNGEDVYPTVCATIGKGTQNQLDVAGAYILDYIRKVDKKDAPPLQPTDEDGII